MHKTLPWRTVLEANNAMVKSRPLTQGEWTGRYEESALRERTLQAKQEHEAHCRSCRCWTTPMDMPGSTRPSANGSPTGPPLAELARTQPSAALTLAFHQALTEPESIASEMVGEELRKYFRCIDFPLTPRLHQTLWTLPR